VTVAPPDDPADPAAGNATAEARPGGGADVLTADGPPVRDQVGTAEPASPARRAPTGRWWDDAAVLHPIRTWESKGRRWLPGVWYPIALWVLWRLGHLAVSVWLGGPDRWGSVVNPAFYYDGQRYLDITRYGYILPHLQMPNTAFFPGVSWLAWPVWQLTHDDLWTGHLTATVTAIAAFVAVWGVSKAWKGEAVARKAVWLLALMPSSLFLWGFYSEGLFIALGAGAVWADRKERRWLAAVLFMALSTTRSVAILIPAVIVLARIIRQRKIDVWAVVYAAAGVIGLIPVLYMMRWYTGNPFAFLGVQSDWGRALSPPWTTVADGFSNLWPRPETIMVPALVARNFDLWCLAIVGVATAYVAFSRKDRFPMEAWMLGVALIILPLCSTSLASFNRFTLADWVIYPAYASMLGRLPVWVRRAAWTTIVVALTVTTYNMVGRVVVDRFVG
jgi:hypothetical protein